MRGALMLSIDINHPDVMKFIKIKRDGTSVTGANISIKLNNEFMKAVENDEDYLLQFPCENFPRRSPNLDSMEYGKLYKGELIKHLISDYKGELYLKKIKAKEYWDEIVHSAKNHAEPGLLYWDNVLDYDPASVYDKYKPISTNPCGEQALNANDSCRLMALNLFSFVDNPFTKDAKLNLEKLYKYSYEFARLGDDLIDLELEYIQRIIDKIKNDPEPKYIKRQELELWEKSYANTKAGRRIGLGITALADMLAALGLGYDSEEGMKVIDRVMKTAMEAQLDCTIDLSILRGSFDGWDRDLEFNDKQDKIEGNNKFYQMLCDTFPNQVEKMIKYGRRNVSFSTIAPTGSVSILTQTTSGCEPLFMPFYMRRKKVNPGENIRVDFIDEIGDSWQEFPVLHEKFKDWLYLYAKWNNELEGKNGFDYWISEQVTNTELQEWFKQSPWYQSTANDIDWIKRNEIQAILQKYTTNAISSTINLPSTVTEQEVSNIYMSGWKMGLKGQTIYVDGSRSGVLIAENKDENIIFEYKDAPKRPKFLPCKVHKSTSKGEDWLIIVGLMNNKPYEVFCVKNNFNLSSQILEGNLIKVKKGKYKLIIPEIAEIEDITSEMTNEQETVTRLLSTSLRHGADIKFLVEQLSKTNGNMFTFTKSLSRILKKYIPEGSKSTINCEKCNSKNVIFQEGCSLCLNCGHSKCG